MPISLNKCITKSKTFVITHWASKACTLNEALFVYFLKNLRNSGGLRLWMLTNWRWVREIEGWRWVKSRYWQVTNELSIKRETIIEGRYSRRWASANAAQAKSATTSALLLVTIIIQLNAISRRNNFSLTTRLRVLIVTRRFNGNEFWTKALFDHFCERAIHIC